MCKRYSEYNVFTLYFYYLLLLLWSFMLWQSLWVREKRNSDSHVFLLINLTWLDILYCTEFLIKPPHPCGQDAEMTFSGTSKCFSLPRPQQVLLMLISGDHIFSHEWVETKLRRVPCFIFGFNIILCKGFNHSVETEQTLTRKRTAKWEKYKRDESVHGLHNKTPMKGMGKWQSCEQCICVEPGMLLLSHTLCCWWWLSWWFHCAPKLFITKPW